MTSYDELAAWRRELRRRRHPPWRLWLVAPLTALGAAAGGRRRARALLAREPRTARQLRDRAGPAVARGGRRLPVADRDGAPGHRVREPGRPGRRQPDLGRPGLVPALRLVLARAA